MEMIEIVGGVRVHIKLDNRLWGSVGDSAEGKTYIAKLLNVLEVNGKNICVVSWSKSFNEKEILKKLSRDDYKLVFLDRADKYYNKEINERVKELIKNCPVFIDFKCWDALYDIAPSIADVEFSEKEVSIIETNDVRRC